MSDPKRGDREQHESHLRLALARRLAKEGRRGMSIAPEEDPMIAVSIQSGEIIATIPDAKGEPRRYDIDPQAATAFGRSWKLTRQDTGDRHRVAVDALGVLSCSCGDSIYRHRGRCKHAKAVVALLAITESLRPAHAAPAAHPPLKKESIPMTNNPFENRSPRPEEAPAFEVPPADTHYGYLIGLIDLGVHVESFQGQNPKPKRKVALVWELTECKKTNGANFIVAERYTCEIPLHPKSRLRTDLETWRRRPYAPGEDIPITKFVGWPWSLDLTHSTTVGADGQKKVFVKIAKLGPVKKGTVVPPPTRDSIIWFAGCGQPIPDYDWLPHLYGAKIADLIGIGLEGLARPGAQPSNGKAGARQEEPANEEQEIPF